MFMDYLSQLSPGVAKKGAVFWAVKAIILTGVSGMNLMGVEIVGTASVLLLMGAVVPTFLVGFIGLFKGMLSLPAVVAGPPPEGIDWSLFLATCMWNFSGCVCACLVAWCACVWKVSRHCWSVLVVLVFGMSQDTGGCSLRTCLVASDQDCADLCWAGRLPAELYWTHRRWESVGNVAGNVKRPGRTFPRGVLLVIVIAVTVYVLPVAIGVSVAPDVAAWEEGFLPEVAAVVGGQPLKGRPIAVG